MSDFDEYCLFQRSMKEMIEFKEDGSPEFIEVWRRVEEIKNKHGGMPPEPPAKESKA